METLAESERDQFLVELKKEQLANITVKSLKKDIEDFDDGRKAAILLRIAQLNYVHHFSDNPLTEEVTESFSEDPILEGLSIAEDFENLKGLFEVLKALVKAPPFTNKRGSKKKKTVDSPLDELPDAL